MKTNFYIALFSFLFITACEKDIPTHYEYDSYSFTNIDKDAGNWKTTLISSPLQLNVISPTATTSPEYIAELAQLKSTQQSLSDNIQSDIKYWTNNPVLRWNEIARELIAKYNLIPGPNDDGTYTLPNASNPAGPPPFPFAHPPYACRALAYLSVAQYDGLITAWHYKFKYSRAAACTTDPSIRNFHQSSTIPSYPSDEAVVATVSKEILTAMFPLEKEYLAALELKHLAAIKSAGICVQSDVDAGVFIAKEIAKLALQRASSDGMKNAQTPKAVADSIKNEAISRFGWSWSNQEIPVRPVGLTPLFSKVRMWNVPNVESVRPGPPPAFGTDEYEKCVAELKDYAKNLTRERRRIANYWSDGLGTYTPPGHWNEIATEIIIGQKLNPIRTARIMAYMNMAIMDGGISCWDAKYYYHYPRPIQNIEGFKTILGTPNFPSYTSGHSVFSSSAASVLAYFFPSSAQSVDQMAKEAAVSRIYGGIHWAFDASAGLTQGKAVAQYTIDLAKKDGAE
ncbi:MAG TPA: phosphatase PAP2 family protein [Saprospiraceae bacterium]|nr:phosphatase PAP2 family protein [Saprospiraceae bacterium]